MAQIQTYPRKTTYDANDLILICDKTPDANGVVTNDTKTTTISTIADNLNVVDTVTASGAGITASPNKGDVVIANTGVTSLVAGSNIDISGSTGAVTISTSASNVDGSGTTGTIPKWSDSNTLTDSPFTIDTSTNSLDIPTFIRHIGDTDSKFGFQGVDHFRVETGGQTTIQSISRTDENNFTGQVAGLYFNSSQRLFTRGEGVEVEGSLFMPGYIKHIFDNDSFFGFSSPNNFVLHTDSGVKIAAGPTGATLYNDENGSTTVSKQSLLTYDSGIIVKGGTENSFARGGAVRFYTSTNNGYVGISGPTTSGTNYEVVLPNAVGTASQVLKLPSTIGSTPYQLEWGDAGSGGGGVTSTADGGTGTNISSADIYNILIGNGSSGASSGFGLSKDNETAIQLPVGNTARRPSADANNVGLIRYNSQAAQFEGIVEDSVGSGTYSWVKFDVTQ